jgi:PHD/YefM family antitoxin component YafN of YafNO toxin-antitoxin module
VKTKQVKKEREVIYRNGKPAAVIVDIEEYREMLERIEDAEDIKALAKIRTKPLKLRPLADYLAEPKRRA